jgi:AcrR family transcriptional regulator
MWAGEEWRIPMPVGLAEDLTWSTVVLASQQGLGAVTFRALARHARLAAGTITNHYASKAELFSISAGVLARWLGGAGCDHVDLRGPVGLFPAQSDPNYRALVSTWIQFEAAALPDPDLSARVVALRPTAALGLTAAFPELADRELAIPSMLLASLRDRVIRIGSDLSPQAALAELQATLRIT